MVSPEEGTSEESAVNDSSNGRESLDEESKREEESEANDSTSVEDPNIGLTTTGEDDPVGAGDVLKSHYEQYIDDKNIDEDEDHDDEEEMYDSVGPLGDVSEEEDDEDDDLSAPDIELGKTGTSAAPPSGVNRGISSSILSVSPVPSHVNRRSSVGVDLASGKANQRGHHAMLRSDSSFGPVAPGQRRRHEMQRYLSSRFPRLQGTADLDNGRGRLKGREKKMKTAVDDSPRELKSSVHGRLEVSEVPVANSRHGSTHGRHSEHDDDSSGEVDGEPIRQYRLSAVQADSGKSSVWSCLGLSSGVGGAIYEDTGSAAVDHKCFCCGLPSANSLVIRYLHWTFRSSFPAVLLSAACGWFTFITIFAVGIWAIGLRRPTCIGIPSDEDGKRPPLEFIDSFELSWTTFSTVGYGLVYAGISTDEEKIHICTGLTILVTLEAFVGVLFASMCGAIVFAKISRSQSYAQVVFSDPMVIRYGSGLQSEQDAGSDDESTEEEAGKRYPCPILEFRVINRMSGTPGGEILDASVNIVASIDANQACPSVRKAAARRRRGKKGKKGGPRRQAASSAIRRRSSANVTKVPEDKPIDSSESLRHLYDAALSTAQSGGQPHQAFEEDPTGHIVAKRIFAKLEMESPDHPFFKRVWILRHTLDENSPLLRAHARHMVQRNAGFWPKELNNPDGVRAAVLFDQILVSMSGTSNADANSVYAQKIYHFSDVNVGYRFVNLLYRDPTDGSLQIDPRLLNDVSEQAGGGGESLVRERAQSVFDLIVL